MKKVINPVKGTREFYPDEMGERNWLYTLIRDVSESFGYQEFDGPFLEKLELYAAKSGEELIKEQAFVFPDRGGELIVLRPELTPSLARMVAQKQGELSFPMRWWSYGPFWRYEKPQKGRTREFFQWNIDMIGINTTEADAELIGVAALLFKKAGLKSDQVRILINDRMLMDSEISKLNINHQLLGTTFKLIDKRDKLPYDVWIKMAKDSGISNGQIRELCNLLENKDLWKQSENLIQLFSILDMMGYSDFVEYDASVIRGLDYYTSTVFEARAANKEGRAILGGGHYNNLVEDVGGEPLPGVGFAMGDVMFPLVLKQNNLMKPAERPAADVMVTVFDENCRKSAIQFAMGLREQGIHTICYPEISKLQRQLKNADKLGIQIAVVIGPDEIKNGNVTLKDLSNHTQKLVNSMEAYKLIKGMLA